MADVDYGNILSRSKHLTLKNKWLWVYGLVLAALGGGGSSSNSGSSSSSHKSSVNNTTIQNLPKDIPEKAKEVLGATTTAVQSWFHTVPPGMWILLVFGILLLVGIGIIFSLVVQNWATGALIAGLDDADAEKPVNLKTTSPKGVVSLKPLVLFSLLIGVIVLGLIIGVALIFGLGFLAFYGSLVGRIVWGILIGLIGIIVIVGSVLITSFASIYAQRLIVLHGFTVNAAFKKSLSLAKHHFFPTLIMGVINGAIGCGAGCVSTLIALIILGIPAAIILIPAFIGGFHMPSVTSIGVLVLLFFVFTQFSLIVSAGLVVFNQSNWNLFVKKILAEEKNL